MLIASREMMSLPDATPPAPAHWLGYYVEAINANATVSMGMSGGGTAPTPSLLYSTDAGITWSPFDVNGGTTITLANVGDRVYFCADEGGNTAFGSPSTDNDYYRFRFNNGYVKIGGNILSLLSPTEVTDFPATTARDTFKRLYYGQSYLRDASALVFPPSTLEACYKCMFESCSGLTTPPALLPATVLSSNCYAYMFRYDTALTSSPVLAATTMVNNCYDSLFNGCRSLSSITTSQTSFTGCLWWTQSVAASGTMYCTEALGDEYTIQRGTSACPNGWNVVVTDRYWGFYTEARQANSTVSMTLSGTSPTSATLEYSTDNGTTWSPFTLPDGGNTPTTITLANVGDRALFRAGSNGNTGISNSTGRRTFAFTGNVLVGGNILSLLSQTEITDFPQGTTPAALAYLFAGQTALTDVQSLKLPATTLIASCYERMFYGCTAITVAPGEGLPATTLAQYCYCSMFQGCTGLATAPALPATTLADYCYSSMFRDCTALSAAPALVATTMVPRCYESMFSGCTSLTTAPALPAESLAEACYSGMFQGCSAITFAPELPAATMVTDCYAAMFSGCSNLAKIQTKQTSFTGCSNWVANVAANGNFYCPPTLGTESTIARGVSACPVGWGVAEKPAYWGFWVEAVRAGATVKMQNSSGPSVTLEYSTDGGDTWANFSATGGTTVTLAAVGDRVCFRSGTGGNTRFSSYDSFYHYFNFGDQVKVGGNILSLLSQTEITAIPSSDTFTFASLFSNQTALIDASDLVMPTNITGHGYQYMFQGCSNLTAAPALPATTLADACYSYMYKYCSSLQSITTSQTAWYDNISACYGWVDGVASIGAFHCPSALGTGATIARGMSNCPSNWAVINT